LICVWYSYFKWGLSCTEPYILKHCYLILSAKRKVKRVNKEVIDDPVLNEEQLFPVSCITSKDSKCRMGTPIRELQNLSMPFLLRTITEGKWCLQLLFWVPSFLSCYIQLPTPYHNVSYSQVFWPHCHSQITYSSPFYKSINFFNFPYFT
jgi:hypothetical protein